MKHWLITIAATALLGLLGSCYYMGWTQPYIYEVIERTGLRHGSPQPSEPRPTPASPGSGAAPDRTRPRLTPDGLLSVPAAQQAALGVETVEVRPQSRPIELELLGTTAYNPDTLTKVRPRFDTLVAAVHVTLGQSVKVGEPLLDLYSAQLAEAKTIYETTRTQWEHDRRLLDARESLYRSNAISQQLWADTQNDEIQSRLAYRVARDKLLVYGLSEAQIDNLGAEEGAQKAMMTIRSPAEGIVITRDAVPGNLYEPTDVLLVIAPLGQLWVWGNVYESDLPLVAAGQTWEVRFPFLDEAIEGRVEYIANQVDPQTHAVRIRGSIANPAGRLKSDMLVRTLLEIPPVAGRTVIPRIAMIVADGANYVFVRKAGTRDQFEQRTIEVAQERSKEVVVASGLRSGEILASAGSLLLQEIYDDLRMAESGTP